MRNTIAMFFLLASIGTAQTLESWTVDTDKAVPKPLVIRRGETRDLRVTFKNYSAAAAIPTNASVQLWYRSADISNGLYYVITGSVHSAAAGTARVLWTSAHCGTATNYTWDLVVLSNTTPYNLRAFGTIQLQAGVYSQATTATNPGTYLALDWARIVNVNTNAAPFGGGGGGSDPNAVTNGGATINGFSVSNGASIVITAAVGSVSFPAITDLPTIWPGTATDDVARARVAVVETGMVTRIETDAWEVGSHENLAPLSQGIAGTNAQARVGVVETGMVTRVSTNDAEWGSHANFATNGGARLVAGADISLSSTIISNGAIITIAYTGAGSSGGVSAATATGIAYAVVAEWATTGTASKATTVTGPQSNLITTAWQNPASATNWTWTSDGTQITLTGYTGPDAVVVPDMLDGLPVTGFGTIFQGSNIVSLFGGANVLALAVNAFYQSRTLTAVSLPSVTSLGASSLDGCWILTSVSLPAVTNVGESAFYQCYDLASLSLPLATSFDDYSFPYCNALSGLYLGQNAPTESVGVFREDSIATIFVTNPQATGWTNTWNGRPVVRLPVYADNFYGSGTGLTGITAAQVGAVSNTAAGIAAAGGVTGGVFSVGTVVSNVAGMLYIPTNVLGGVNWVGADAASTNYFRNAVNLTNLTAAGILTNTPTLQQVTAAGGTVTGGVVTIDSAGASTNTFGGLASVLGNNVKSQSGTLLPGAVGGISLGVGNTIGSNANGTVAMGSGSKAYFEGGIAAGKLCVSSNFYAVAFGYKGNALDDSSMVWSGSGASYSSHGAGTLNLNPNGGTSGLYIGETTLASIFAGYVATNGSGSSLTGITAAQVGAASNNAAGIAAAGGVTGGTLSVGTTVSNVNGVLFIPSNVLQGATGPQGPSGTNGTNGANGTNGLNAYVSVTNVVTLAAGASAWASNNIVDTTNYLTLGIPQGQVGTNGATGPQGPQGPAGTNATGGIDAPTATNIVQAALARFSVTNSIAVTNSTTFSIGLPSSSVCLDDVRVYATTPGTYSKRYSLRFFRSSDFRRTHLAYTFTNGLIYATTTTVAQAVGAITNVVPDASGIIWPIDMYWQSAGGETNDYVSFTNASATVLWGCCTNTIAMPVGSLISHVEQLGSFNFWGGPTLYGDIVPTTGWTGTVQIVIDGARK